jgi:hypothetical protein
MADLSPAAKPVWDAYEELLEHECVVTKTDMKALAAALLAAVNQVVPEADTMDTEEWVGQSAWQQAEQSVRFRFLSIVAELEAAND